MNLRSAQAPAMYVGDHKHVCLRNGTHKPPRARSLSEPPQDVAFSSLFCFFVLSARAYRSEVAVTSSSPTPFVSLRGLFNTNQRSLSKQRADAPGSETRVRGGAAGAEL